MVIWVYNDKIHICNATYDLLLLLLLTTLLLSLSLAIYPTHSHMRRRYRPLQYHQHEKYFRLLPTYYQLPPLLHYTYFLVTSPLSPSEN